MLEVESSLAFIYQVSPMGVLLNIGLYTWEACPGAKMLYYVIHALSSKHQISIPFHGFSFSFPGAASHYALLFLIARALLKQLNSIC